MTHPVWHEYLNLLSFFAAVIGLYVLYNVKSKPGEELDDADHTLLALSFAYWVVHCMAVGAQRMIHPDWEIAVMSLKFTAIFSYLLTFSSALSLPLHQISARQNQTEP
ncbi:MAG: hypothetical protein HC780_15385 [Leptolyngbyaceae cyanobacterium CSU_1_3]|nr:hypothetical protein [Leptolyngbyaceae cyanobacterium CSU_1_3]